MDMRVEKVNQVDEKQLLAALAAFKKGDFSTRLPSDWMGMAGKIADTFNDIVETNQQIEEGISGVSRIVGREGRLTDRATLTRGTGGWATIVRSVNALIDDLVRPTTEMARIIGGVAKGDLSQSMALEGEGRPLQRQIQRPSNAEGTGGKRGWQKD